MWSTSDLKSHFKTISILNNNFCNNFINLDRLCFAFKSKNVNSGQLKIKVNSTLGFLSYNVDCVSLIWQSWF